MTEQLRVVIDTKEGNQQIRLIKAMLKDVNKALKQHAKLIGLARLEVEVVNLGKMGDWNVRVNSDLKKGKK